MQQQRQLGNATNMFNVAMERLSTGVRINSAADDAAGLYIAKGLESEISSLRSAQNSMSQALNFYAMASENAGKMTEILMRIRNLTLQANNDIYTPEARQALQDEANGLIEQLYLALCNQFAQPLMGRIPGCVDHAGDQAAVAGTKGSRLFTGQRCCKLHIFHIKAPPFYVGSRGS